MEAQTPKYEKDLKLYQFDPLEKPKLTCNSCGTQYDQQDIKAIQKWKYSTLVGDDYYELTCSSCTHGPEILLRLNMSWIDVVTITLLNLIKSEPCHYEQENIKYYHWKGKICEFVENNWHIFWAKSKSNTWRNSVASCLSTGNRFISLTKNTTTESDAVLSELNTVGLWGLDVNVVKSEPRKMKQAGSSITEDGTLIELQNDHAKRKRKDTEVIVEKKNRSKRILNLEFDFDPASAISVYPELDNPTGPVRLSNESTHSAPQCRISPNGLSCSNDKGYRMIKASHGVWEGYWYFEVRFEKNGHARIGWSQISGDLQAPCGYDQFSYSLRDSPGTLFHCSLPYYSEIDFSAGYKVGDVLGCAIYLPERQRSVDDIAVDERLLARLWDPSRMESYIPFQTAPLEPVPDSRIEFYLNGRPYGDSGIAFKDINQGKYYPCISLYNGAGVTCNFGPDFWFPKPQEAESFDKVTSLPTWTTIIAQFTGNSEENDIMSVPKPKKQKKKKDKEEPDQIEVEKLEEIVVADIEKATNNDTDMEVDIERLESVSSGIGKVTTGPSSPQEMELLDVEKTSPLKADSSVVEHVSTSNEYKLISQS